VVIYRATIVKWIPSVTSIAWLRRVISHSKWNTYYFLVTSIFSIFYYFLHFFYCVEFAYISVLFFVLLMETIQDFEIIIYSIFRIL